MLNFNVFSHKNLFLLCPTHHKCQLNLGHLQEKHCLYGNCRHICNFYCQGHIFLNQVTIFRESTHQLRNIYSDCDMCKQDFFFPSELQAQLTHTFQRRHDYLSGVVAKLTKGHFLPPHWISHIQRRHQWGVFKAQKENAANRQEIKGTNCQSIELKGQCC